MRAFAARGRTIVFATHYLEEADAYADRAVLMAHGRIVADGPTTEIKAMVGTRTIRATLPGVEAEALAALPGVSGVERRGEAVILALCGLRSRRSGRCSPRIRTRATSRSQPRALEQAFLALTGDASAERPPSAAEAPAPAVERHER